MTRALLALLLLVAASPAWAQDDHSNTTTGASTLTESGLAGRIEIGGDRDVFRLEAVSGVEYRVATSDLTGGMDTILDLYAPSGQHLRRDDDGAGNLASQITFTASETASYWVLVTHYDRNNGTGGYRVRGGRTSPAPSPTSPTSTTPTTPSTPSTPASPTTGGGSLDFARVLDPKLAGASLEIDYRLDQGASISLEVRDANGSLVQTVASGQRSAGQHLASWDGVASNGLFAAPGSYVVRLRAGSATLAERPLSIVRLGIQSLSFSGHVPLTFHDADGFQSRMAADTIGPAWTLPESALGPNCLDASSGNPLSLPARHLGLAAPPRTSGGALLRRGINLPLAYALGTRPSARALVGREAAANGASVSCGYPISGVPLRVAVEGGASVGSMSGELVPGGETTLDLPATASSVGKRTVTYRFRFYYQAGNAWLPVPGGQTTEHTVYSTFGRPDDLPNRRPWIAALDLASRFASGASTRREAMTKVVAGVNSQLGLRYDVNSGAPAYTDGWELHRPELDLDAFLDDLDNGRVVNCLDCASIVTKLAGQLAVPTQVAILGWDFRLNYLRGIGYGDFTASLFGGNHAFSYHAVGTTDQGATIDDACLELDDDARPWASPFTSRLPAGISFDRYRQQLSPDLFRLRNVGAATLD